MARPTTIRDEDILVAAREVFLERGIRATTADVAERAGVSEGSLFRRFRTKVDLFQRCLAADLENPVWIEMLTPQRAADAGDARELLVVVCARAADHFRRVLPLLMMKWSNPELEGRFPPIMTGNDPPALRHLRTFAGFLDAMMRAGRIRQSDAEVLARQLVGGVQSYVLLELWHEARNELPLPLEMYLRGMIENLWVGIDPNAARAVATRRDGRRE
jgi:AcrR family transcriptional regulator